MATSDLHQRQRKVIDFKPGQEWHFLQHRFSLLRAIHDKNPKLLNQLIPFEDQMGQYAYDFLPLLSEPFLKWLMTHTHSTTCCNMIGSCLGAEKELIFYLGTFQVFHLDHLKLAQLCYQKCQQKLTSCNIVIIPQYLNISKPHTVTTYQMRLNQLSEVCTKYEYLQTMALPASNVNAFNSTLFPLLANLNGGQLNWLWGSDNLIKFSQQPGGGSHHGIFNHPNLNLYVSRRSSDSLKLYNQALKTMRNKYKANIIKLPDRAPIDDLNISSSFLIEKIQTNNLYKKYILHSY